MTEDTNNSEDTNFRERLVLVEQQQKNQKEVLMDINETLKEVVKTQYVLANQREEIDRLSKENESIARSLHARDVEEAKTALLSEQQAVLLAQIEEDVYKKMMPHQNRMKTYLKIAGTVLGAAWAALLVYLKYFLEN